MTLQINNGKRWKLEDLAQQSYSARKVDAWVYYCILCDEVLFISRRFVEAKGVQAAFDGICPDCGFGLKNIMRCEHVQLPHTQAIYVNPKYQAPLLVEFPSRTFDAIRIQNARLPEEGKILATGIAKLDKLVHLTTGQLIVFQGYPFSKSLAGSLCVRAQLDHPIGLSSDVIFIDGGNCFDAYAVPEYAIEHRIEPKLALSRIHVSRAFTYFQLASLLIEKLPSALMRYNSTFAIISNITELFEDPEIKDKQEAYRIFQRMLRSLTAVTEITGSLVIATSSRKDINPFDTMLTQTAHTTIRAEDRVTFTRFTLVHHKSLPPLKVSQRENGTDQFLEDYMER